MDWSQKLGAENFTFRDAEDGTKTLTLTVPASTIKQSLAGQTKASLAKAPDAEEGTAKIEEGTPSKKKTRGKTKKQDHVIKFSDPPGRAGFASFFFEVRDNGLGEGKEGWQWPTEHDGLLFPAATKSKSPSLSPETHQNALKRVRRGLPSAYSA